jgi:protocatechuate 3,4-dioxygenase beta subunit
VNLLPLAPVPVASQSAPVGSGIATLAQTTNGPAVAIGRPKSATTDSQGAFELRDLPAGRYRLMASPGQYSAGYLTISFGATKPNAPGSTDTGTPIEVADGQTFDKANIALPRGGVITGRVTDDNGEPLARVQVYTIVYLAGSSRGLRTGGNAQTDDLGQFRMFGLAPGEYVVAAEARGNTFVAPNAAPETEDDKIGFMTTFYPGTGDEAAAQRVRTKAGAETPGVEIRMVSGRLFHISGMVTDSQGHSTGRANGNLFKRSTSGTTTSYGFGTDDQGRFQMRNIQPGDYRLVVRQQQPGPPRNPDGSPADPGEFATMMLTINTDLDDILVTTAPGATITGTVVFENGPPQLPTGTLQMRVNATPGDVDGNLGMPLPQPALVSADLTFRMTGLAGEVLLRGGAPQNTLKSVLLAGGEEITDTPHAFKNGESVTIVLTNQASTVEGTVTDATGKPVTDAAVVMFSDDKNAWRSNSVRTRRTSADVNGHFRMQGVLPGRYYLIAMPRDRMNGITLGIDPSAFEALSKEATSVVVGQDEQRQIDIKLSSGGGL